MTDFACGCGSPDGSGDTGTEVDCAEVMAEVWTLLDGECTPESRERLRHHLESCAGCLRLYGVEERIKLLIATKCSGETAPQGLRERVRLEISRTTILRGYAGPEPGRV